MLEARVADVVNNNLISIEKVLCSLVFLISVQFSSIACKMNSPKQTKGAEGIHKYILPYTFGTHTHTHTRTHTHTHTHKRNKRRRSNVDAEPTSLSKK